MIRYFHDLIQGTDEWRAARCGLLTASEMQNIITPAKLQYARSEKERTHLHELAAQRLTRHLEPHYVNDDMLRGIDDEVYARIEYTKHYASVETVGFITNDKFGFVLGYSPDGLVNDDGVIEVKSRRQKFQLETIIAGEMPAEYSIQVQTGLLVSERKWCDFISYCGGMPMLTIRVHPDAKVQAAVLDVAAMFHARLNAVVESYQACIADAAARLIPTERRVEQELIV